MSLLLSLYFCWSDDVFLLNGDWGVLITLTKCLQAHKSLLETLGSLFEGIFLMYSIFFLNFGESQRDDEDEECMNSLFYIVQVDNTSPANNHSLNL